MYETRPKVEDHDTRTDSTKTRVTLKVQPITISSFMMGRILSGQSGSTVFTKSFFLTPSVGTGKTSRRVVERRELDGCSDRSHKRSLFPIDVDVKGSSNLRTDTV